MFRSVCNVQMMTTLTDRKGKQGVRGKGGGFDSGISGYFTANCQNTSCLVLLWFWLSRYWLTSGLIDTMVGETSLKCILENTPPPSAQCPYI